MSTSFGEETTISGAALVPRLMVLSHTLQHVFNAEADDRLLVVGDRLSAAIGVFNRLSASFDELRGVLSHSELGDAAARLKDVGHDVAMMVTMFADEREVLVRLVDLNRDVSRRLAAFRKTARAIAMLSTNAQVAAAGAGLRSNDIAALTAQFRGLATTANATIEASARECQGLKLRLDAARSAHLAFESDHGERLSNVAGQLDAFVATVDRQRGQAAEATRVIGQRSQSVSEEIGAVVVALQISDITRQRLEHIAEALTMLAAGLDGDERPSADEPAWSAGLSDEAKGSVAARVCRLQEAQLAHALSDYDREVKRVANSLGKLIEDALELVRLARYGYGSDEGRYASFLDELRGRVDATTALIATCQAARLEVDQDIRSAAATLPALLEQLEAVQGIEVDMRFVSLNTTFQCDRIGAAGRVLAVIAKQLATRANRMVEDVNAMIPVLQEIATTADAFERSRDSTTTAERIGGIESSIETALATLEDSGSQLGRALSTLSGEGEKVGGMLTQAVERMAAFVEVGRVMRAAHDRFTDIAETVEERTEDAAIVDERLRLFPADRYTMAREREIHLALAVGSRLAASDNTCAPAGVPNEQSLDDILF